MFGPAATRDTPIPPAILHQAQAAADMQDYVGIAEIFRRASEAMPGHFLLKVYHAGALGQAGRFVEARRIFKDLQRAVPGGKQADFRGLVGTIWRNMGRNDLAEPHLRAMVEFPECPVGGHEALVDVLERLNREDDARRALDAALRKFPRHPTLLLLSGRLLRRRREWDRAESQLRLCLSSPATHPALWVEAGYELGHVLDGQGRFREAFASFQAAKAGPRASAAAELQAWRSRMDYMRSPAAVSPAECFKRWAEPVLGESLRQAFLVGCPRSGTTLLERVLDAHPEIIGAPETTAWRCDVWIPLLKELRASGRFSDKPAEAEVLDGVTREQIVSGYHAYRAAMDAVMETTVGPRLLVDKNPSYFPLIAALMRMFPGAKLLVALRDPRAVVWSCFTQALPLNPETVSFLDLGTTAEHTAVWLENWLRLRERIVTPWREVRYESMVRNFGQEARETLEFLGVAWDPKVAEFHKGDKPVRSPSYAAVSRPIYGGSVEKWRHYEEFMAPHLAPLKPVMAELGYAW